MKSHPDLERAFLLVSEEIRAELQDRMTPELDSILRTRGLGTMPQGSRRQALEHHLVLLAAYFHLESGKTSEHRWAPRTRLTRLRRGQLPNRKALAKILDDAVLVEALLENEPGADRAFRDGYERWIEDYIDRRFDPEARSEFEGFTNHLLARRQKYFGGYEGRYGLKPWLRKILENRLRDWRKGKSRERQRLEHLASDPELHDNGCLMAQPADGSLTPSDPSAAGPHEVADLEVVERFLPLVEQALGRLKPIQELVLRLTILDELTLAQAGVILKRSPAQVCRIRLEALNRLFAEVDAAVEASPEPTRSEFREIQMRLNDPSQSMGSAVLAVSVAGVLRLQEIVGKVLATITASQRKQLRKAMGSGRPLAPRWEQLLDALRDATLAEIEGQGQCIRFGQVLEDVRARGPRFMRLVARALG